MSISETPSGTTTPEFIVDIDLTSTEVYYYSLTGYLVYIGYCYKFSGGISNSYW